MWIDGEKTIKALIEKARIVLIKLRDPSKVQAAVEQMSKILQPRPITGQAAAPPVLGPAA
jgi:hypothetical protein